MISAWGAYARLICQHQQLHEWWCRAEPVEPLFGTLVWAMWRSLRLTFRKVLTSAENKKLFLTTMVQLITTATARQTDPALLRECLNIVRLWLLEPENGGEPKLPNCCHANRYRLSSGVG